MNQQITANVNLPVLHNALAKAIITHPAISEKVKEDPELSQLYTLFLEADLQLHYQANSISTPQP